MKKFPNHSPVVTGAMTQTVKPSFYEGDRTLQLIIDQYLSDEFKTYAHEHLHKFGHLTS